LPDWQGCHVVLQSSDIQWLESNLDNFFWPWMGLGLFSKFHLFSNSKKTATSSSDVNFYRVPSLFFEFNIQFHSTWRIVIIVYYNYLIDCVVFISENDLFKYLCFMLNEYLSE
jgi:hypothetical protein